MRTKTLLLSALLGALGSVSVHAQNVYSLNAVGYINVTFPAGSYTILTVPLQASPDNTLNTLLPNTSGAYKHAEVYFFAGGGYTVTAAGVSTNANASGWTDGGTDTIEPGQAVFFFNNTAAAMTATFVGQVISGPTTNTIIPGYNLIGSQVPASGDIVTNSIMDFTNGLRHDYVYTYNDAGQTFNPITAIVLPGNGAPGSYLEEWTGGDPSIANPYDGFFYWNNALTNNTWVENFSVSQ